MHSAQIHFCALTTGWFANHLILCRSIRLQRMQPNHSISHQIQYTLMTGQQARKINIHGTILGSRPRCSFSFYWKINCIFSDIGNVMRWADNLKIFVDVSIRILVFPQFIFAARMTRWTMISFVISGNDSLNVSHYPIIFLTGNYDVHGRENELKKKKKKNSNAITRSSTDMSFHYMHSLQTFSRFLCLCFVATK